LHGQIFSGVDAASAYFERFDLLLFLVAGSTAALTQLQRGIERAQKHCSLPIAHRNQITIDLDCKKAR